MLVDSGTLDMSAWFSSSCFLLPYYNHSSPTSLFPKHVPVYHVVSITTHVGGFWHIGHDIMFSWHVYHLWSGHDVLYPFRFSLLHTPFITHSIIVKTHFMVSFLSRQPHMLVDSGTLDMSAWFSPSAFLLPYYTHSSPTLLIPKHVQVYHVVSITTHVGDSWHTGHDIMFSPHSDF
jgi:hypothetical protein